MKVYLLYYSQQKKSSKDIYFVTSWGGCLIIGGKLTHRPSLRANLMKLYTVTGVFALLGTIRFIHILDYFKQFAQIDENHTTFKISSKN